MEDGEEIATYSLRIGVSFFNVMLFVIMISVLGAIIDLSVSIASSMDYIYLNEPHLTRSELYRSGLNVAKDILSTTTNTLYFAYLGTGMTLMVWFKNVDYSFEQIINSKVFSQEILMIISGGVAVAIAIPVTCLTASYIILIRYGWFLYYAPSFYNSCLHLYPFDRLSLYRFHHKSVF